MPSFEAREGGAEIWWELGLAKRRWVMVSVLQKCSSMRSETPLMYGSPVAPSTMSIFGLESKAERNWTLLVLAFWYIDLRGSIIVADGAAAGMLLIGWGAEIVVDGEVTDLLLVDLSIWADSDEMSEMEGSSMLWSGASGTACCDLMCE